MTVRSIPGLGTVIALVAPASARRRARPPGPTRRRSPTRCRPAPRPSAAEATIMDVDNMGWWKVLRRGRGQTRWPTATADRRLARRKAVRALVAVAAPGRRRRRAEAELEPAVGEPQYRALATASRPHPALLFVSGCSEFTPHEAPHHYGRVADEFAARGYVVIFVDYLGVRGRDIGGGAVRLPRSRQHPRRRGVRAPCRSSGFRDRRHRLVQRGQWRAAVIAALPAGTPAPSGRPSPTIRVLDVETPWSVRVPLLDAPRRKGRHIVDVGVRAAGRAARR